MIHHARFCPPNSLFQKPITQLPIAASETLFFFVQSLAWTLAYVRRCCHDYLMRTSLVVVVLSYYLRLRCLLVVDYNLFVCAIIREVVIHRIKGRM